MGNTYIRASNGVFRPVDSPLPACKLRMVSWDLYGVIHPDEEVLSENAGGRMASPTVASQSKILSTLLDGKDLKTIEMEVFGPSTGENLSAPLVQVDYSHMSPVNFLKYYLIRNGIKPGIARVESREFVNSYVEGIKESIDRRILDGLIPELRRVGVLSQIITDRTVLALAVARMVPGYITKRRFPLGVVSSQQLKLHKPDPNIYKFGLELAAFRFGDTFEPSQSVMIDDREYNLIGCEEDNFTKGAVGAGMYGIRYRGYEQLIVALKDLGANLDLKREI